MITKNFLLNILYNPQLRPAHVIEILVKHKRFILNIQVSKIVKNFYETYCTISKLGA